MSDGPIEVQLASEEVMRRNSQAIVDSHNRMRKEWAEAKKIVENLQKTVHMQNARFDQMQHQISMLQAKLYAAGTES